MTFNETCTDLCNILGDSYVFDKNDGNGSRYYRLEVRPFELTYHGEDRFHLGQSVMVPYESGNRTVKSIITKIEWNFRGGQKIECSGSDNRILFDSARRTPSKRAKEDAISKANYLADELNKKFQSDMEQQYKDFSNGLTSQWNTLQKQIGDLSDTTGDAQGDLVSQLGALETNINSLKQELRNQGLTIS